MTPVYFSPCDGLLPTEWEAKTKRLSRAFPLKRHEIASAVLDSWDSLFGSGIGRHGIRIGRDIFPTPQIMGAFLHELIPREVAARHPGKWRGDQGAQEKDLVYIPNPKYSAEIKTWSDPRKIYANRSSAQAATSFKKNKNGCYIAINFEKFSPDRTAAQRPGI